MKKTTNYYQILKIKPASSQEEIKKAYLNEVKKYHPDKNYKNKIAERRLQNVNMAYQILGNAQEREKFDKKFFKENNITSSKNIHSKKIKKTPLVQINVLDGTPLDLQLDLKLDIKDLLKSKTHKIHYLKPIAGKKEKASVSIKIPKGSKSNSKLRIKKKGGSSGFNHFGDLYIHVALKKHPLFKIKNSDIFYNLPVSIIDVVVGKKLEIPSINEMVSFYLPPMVKDGEVFKFKNLGLFDKNTNQYGDMFVKIVIDYSKNEEKEIKKDLKLLNEDPKNNDWFIEKNKDCYYSKTDLFERIKRQLKRKK